MKNVKQTLCLFYYSRSLHVLTKLKFHKAIFLSAFLTLISVNFTYSQCGNIIVTATPGTIDCYGGTTCVNVTATGGLPNYTGTGVFCGYGAGNYIFNVIDANNCPATSNAILITQPLKLEVTIFSTPSGCAPNGTATVIASGGTPAYKYRWTPGGQTTNPAIGLATGTYCVLVTDDNKCNASSCVVVTSSVCNNLTPPGPISGSDCVCQDNNKEVEYCVTPNNLCATSYLWILPTGATAITPTNGPCIKLKFLPADKFASGLICVKAVTPCGNTASTCKNITLITSNPSKPVILGPSTLCPDEPAQYSIIPECGSSYQWSITGPLSITVPDAITNLPYVNVKGPGALGTKLHVTVTNCKGLSTSNISIGLRTGCRVSTNVATTESIFVTEKLTAYPNPTSGKLIVNFYSEFKSEFKLKIIDPLGSVLRNDLITAIEGENTIDLDLSNVAKGMYFLTVEIEGMENQNIRIVID